MPPAEDNVEPFVEDEIGTSKHEESADGDRAAEHVNLTTPQDDLYDEDDEAMIRSRLEALGYL